MLQYKSSVKLSLGTMSMSKQHNFDLLSIDSNRCLDPIKKSDRS
jgi:hypothetical protein